LCPQKNTFYRSYRFRLNDRSAIAGGIGEVESLVTFFRAARRCGPMFELDVFAGVFFKGEISKEGTSKDQKRFQNSFRSPIKNNLYLVLTKKIYPWPRQNFQKSSIWIWAAAR
jgi:hypothetical protein